MSRAQLKDEYPLDLGTVWQDLDPRWEFPCRVKIVGYVGEKIHVEVVENDNAPDTVGKLRQISRAAFNRTGSKGYKFVRKE